jgi:hypothetical protein
MPRSIGFITQGEYQRHGGQSWFEVTLREFDNGHREASIRCTKTLSEPPLGYDPLRNKWVGDEAPSALGSPAQSISTPRGTGDREQSIERATRRARTAARVRCKASAFDSLFTFTYRQNVQDRDLVASHWKECVRRVRAVLPDFAYLAVIERQQRGALHLHVATHRLPATLQWCGVKVKSWSVLRAIWRSVVGGLGGNFDESKRKSRSRASSLRIARYITKYVAKDFADGEFNRKRYWASTNWKAPRRVSMLFPREVDERVSAELLALVFDEVVGSASEYVHWVHPDGFVYWVAAFSPPS